MVSLGSTKSFGATITGPPKLMSLRKKDTNEIIPVVGGSQALTVERWTEKSVDSANARVVPGANISAGDEVEIYKNDGTLMFGGSVGFIRRRAPWIVEMVGHGIELNKIPVQKVYAAGTAIEDVVEDVINTFSTLTFTDKVVSGITLSERFVADDFASNVIEKMRRLLNWQTRTEPTKAYHFEPKGNTNNGVVWERGVNGVDYQEWTQDREKVINSVRVEGDLANYNTSETFVAGVGATEYTLLNEPVGTVLVTIDGTPKDGGSPGSGDYNIDAENLKIKDFTAASGGESVVISYNYQIPIIVEAEDEDSQTNWTNGTKSHRKIKAKYLKSHADASRAAKEFILDNKDPPVANKALKSGLDTSVNVGEIIRSIDNINKNDIDENLVIKRIKWSYPEGVTEADVGDINTNLLDTMTDIIERIQELEKDVSTTGVVRFYRSFDNNLRVNLTGTLSSKYRRVNDTFVFNGINNIVYDIDEAFKIDEMDTPGDYSANGSTVLSKDTTNFWSSDGSLKATTTGAITPVTITNSNSLGDLSTALNVSSGTPDRGTFGLWVYTTQGANISDIKLRIGSSSSDYIEIDAVYYDSLASLNSGWTYMIFVTSTGAVTGTPDWTTVDYLRISYDTSTDTVASWDLINISRSNVIGLCSIGDRRGDWITN